MGRMSEEEKKKKLLFLFFLLITGHAGPQFTAAPFFNENFLYTKIFKNPWQKKQIYFLLQYNIKLT